MVNYFLRFEIPSNLFFHYQAMFKDISLCSKRMIFSNNIYISILSKQSSPFPPMASRTSKFSFMGNTKMDFCFYRMFFTIKRIIFRNTKSFFSNFTHFFLKFFRHDPSYFKLTITFIRTKMMFIKFYLGQLLFNLFFAKIAICFYHIKFLIKKPFSACLIETVKFLRLLRAWFLDIKIPFPLDNTSITDFNILSI